MLSLVVNVLSLILSLALPLLVAGEPQNVTLRLNSPLVSFTPGWKAATFPGTELPFAFADGQNEEVQVMLPEQTTTVFYQGFKVSGGALYFACIDCNSTDAPGPYIFEVDAHDSTENGTQPSTTLFSFTDLDPTRQHVLRVINLEDSRFNHTSQITFDSVTVVIDSAVGGNASTTATTSPSGSTSTGLHGGLQTITVTATDTGANPTSTTPPPRQEPASTSDSSNSRTTNANPPGVTQTTAAQSTSGTNANTPGSPQSTAGAGTSTATVLPTATPQPTSRGGGSQSLGNISTGNGASGGGTTVPGSSATSTPGPEQPQPVPSGSAGAGGTFSQPSASPIHTSPHPTGTSSGSNAEANSSTGVSKTVIIVIAVLASVLVLSLLVAVIVMMVRNQAARRAAADPEGNVGLMREAAPSGVVSGPLGLAPMRPQNPFADSIPADVPLDAPEGAGSVESFSEPEFLPRPPPPAVPPKSPLRSAFNSRTSPWLNRVPRNSSPDSSS
ncbi:hypothetical protein PYCCODRAFT_1464740 [Trametes coccinea BRFM310]|uniref:Mid2 domain-containing protein n=1 Tax=Trametes coccinea (strain BRFM310) TaxID=1353009 RepID=A0A1Y2IYB1_TRAC3|nr:hypothetical protein PYCCODRAFT_1464740 [Trametes coccinea BRFM310]